MFYVKWFWNVSVTEKIPVMLRTKWKRKREHIWWDIFYSYKSFVTWRRVINLCILRSIYRLKFMGYNKYRVSSWTLENARRYSNKITFHDSLFGRLRKTVWELYNSRLWTAMNCDTCWIPCIKELLSSPCRKQTLGSKNCTAWSG